MLGGIHEEDIRMEERSPENGEPWSANQRSQQWEGRQDHDQPRRFAGQRFGIVTHRTCLRRAGLTPFPPH